MKAFDFTRPGVGSGAIGLARRAMDEAIRYSLQRKTMGKPIAQHQVRSAVAVPLHVVCAAGPLWAAVMLSMSLIDSSRHRCVQAVAFMIADMAAGIEAARLLVYKSAWLHDKGLRNTQYARSSSSSFSSSNSSYSPLFLLPCSCTWFCVSTCAPVIACVCSFASMAKCLAADHANKVASDAVQVRPRLLWHRSRRRHRHVRLCAYYRRSSAATASTPSTPSRS